MMSCVYPPPLVFQPMSIMYTHPTIARRLLWSYPLFGVGWSTNCGKGCGVIAASYQSGRRANREVRSRFGWLSA